MKNRVIISLILIILCIFSMCGNIYASGKHMSVSKEIILYQDTYNGLHDYSLNSEILNALKNDYGYTGDTARKIMKINTTIEITDVIIPVIDINVGPINIETTYKVKIGNKNFSGFSKDDLTKSLAIDTDNEEDYIVGKKWNVTIITSFIDDVDVSTEIGGGGGDVHTYKIKADAICSDPNCSTCSNIEERRGNRSNGYWGQ